MYSIVQYGKLAFLVVRTSSIPHQQGEVKPPLQGVFFICYKDYRTHQLTSQIYRTILGPCVASYSLVYAIERLSDG